LVSRSSKIKRARSEARSIALDAAAGRKVSAARLDHLARSVRVIQGRSGGLASIGGRRRTASRFLAALQGYQIAPEAQRG
jgi:hypothetical protein